MNVKVEKTVTKLLITSYNYLAPSELQDCKLASENKSSIATWGYQDNSKPVFFFYKKILCVQKRT